MASGVWHLLGVTRLQFCAACCPEVEEWEDAGSGSRTPLREQRIAMLSSLKAGQEGNDCQHSGLQLSINTADLTEGVAR